MAAASWKAVAAQHEMVKLMRGYNSRAFAYEVDIIDTPGGQPGSASDSKNRINLKD